MKYWNDFRAHLSKPDNLVLVILLALTVFFQGQLLWNLDPVMFPDSDSYMALTENILAWNWTGFHFRTPGYPLFLVIVRFLTGALNPYNITVTQIVLCGAIPFLIFGLFRALVNSPWPAFALSLVYFLDWPSRGTALAVLTESTTQIFLLLTLFLAVRLNTKPSYYLSFIVAISAFTLTMIRPAFLPLAPIIAFTILASAALTRKLNRRIFGQQAVVIFLPLFFVLGWNFEVRRETGTFTMSHITGIALLNQVSDNLNRSQDPPHQELIHLLLQQEKIEGSNLNIGWPVSTAESKRRNIGAWVIAKEMKEISIHLILAYPMDYLRKVTRNLHEYWTDTATYVYSPSGTTKWIYTQSVLGSFYTAIDAQLWLRPGRLRFLVGFQSFLLLITIGFSSLRMDQKVILWLIAEAIVICTFVHVLVNGADLARYRMPIQTLYLCSALYCMGYWISAGVVKMKSRPN